MNTSYTVYISLLLISLSLPLSLQTSAFVPALQKLSVTQSAKTSGEVTRTKIGQKTRGSRKTCVIEEDVDTEDESDGGNGSDSKRKVVKGRKTRGGKKVSVIEQNDESDSGNSDNKGKEVNRKSNGRKDGTGKGHAKKKFKKTLKQSFNN